MRIGYDLRRIENPGIGRYMRQLVDAVLRVAPENEYVLIVAPGTETLFQGGHSVHVVETSAPYYSITEQLTLPRLIRDQGIELFHSPHFLMPLVCSCPVVVTIHDCIYITCPGDLESRIGRAYYRAMMQAAAKKSDRIITDSEFSKSDITRLLGVPPHKVTVVPCAVDGRFRPVREQAKLDEVRSRFGIRGEFVFYAGIFKPRKNHARLLEAFALLRRKGIDAQLVLGGPLGSGEALLRAKAHDLGIEEDVVFAGFVPDSDLPVLYSSATLYACPSTYEGFGFTILEAMACGTAVVCHFGTSLPEVGGGAPLYADACNPEAFAGAMQQVFEFEEVRDKCIAEGLKRTQQFRWEQAARQTIELYRETLSTREARRCA